MPRRSFRSENYRVLDFQTEQTQLAYSKFAILDRELRQDKVYSRVVVTDCLHTRKVAKVRLPQRL
jgi:hypothetical protein